MQRGYRLQCRQSTPFCTQPQGSRRPLHSFPTRRSSDLDESTTPSLSESSHASPTPSPSVSACVAFETAGQLSHSSRSEEHTSELQSQSNLVCRLLLQKKTLTALGRGGGSFVELRHQGAD